MNPLDRLINEAARSSAAGRFGSSFVDDVIAATSGAPAPERPVRLYQTRRFRLVAAVTFLVATLGAIDATRLRTVSAPAGESVESILSDGSFVSVGPGSSISYRKFFLRDRREVQLDGEAFFDVESDGKPFIVQTFNSAVWVTGTRFNLRGRATDRHPETIVSLEEGHVLVYAIGSPDRSAGPVQLEPGDVVRVDAEGAEQDPRIAVSDALSWQHGGLSLVDVPLADAVDQIARRFAIQIEVDEGIADRPTTFVSQRTVRPEDALDAISFALNLRYRRILGGFRIESPNPEMP